MASITTANAGPNPSGWCRITGAVCWFRARDWTDYAAAATIQSEAARAVGIAVRVQGMKRYYGLLLCAGNKVRLVKTLDGETVLAEADFVWESTRSYALRLAVEGNHLRGWIDGQLIVEASDTGSPLSGCGVAYVIEEGTLMSDAMRVDRSDIARSPIQHCADWIIDDDRAWHRLLLRAVKPKRSIAAVDLKG
jgi:hypothetical protein